MPTVLRKDGFNFMIYTDDHEPMHTHVKKVGTAPHIRENKRMSQKDVRKALRITYQYQDYLIAAWKESFISLCDALRQ